MVLVFWAPVLCWAVIGSGAAGAGEMLYFVVPSLEGPVSMLFFESWGLGVVSVLFGGELTWGRP